jgi:dUTP pyrophosphatase
MRIKIKRFDKSLPLPEYKTPGAAGFDLISRITLEIGPHQIGYAPLNIACETPKGYFLLIAARSSLHKKGLMLANGIGIGDPDFSGDGDEYTACLYNFTDKTVRIEAGERIAQGIFVKLEKAEWDEVDKLENPTRGGFGSTGSN